MSTLKLVAILVLGLLAVAQSGTADDDMENEISTGSCTTLPTTIHVTKDELDDSGNVVRMCEGDISVTKCEGTCSSQLKPSVGSPTGFHKHCFCCRESWMKQRTTQLIDCYTPDGVRLEDGPLTTMEIVMQEPEGCQCHKCGL
ncbi:Partner of bursicon [Halotydeus destructor]|nr:Partner of bursicon [Halotydeus destructor]